METEEITKLVDGIYKNILDKFNPGARQLINAGKAYLKALHGAAAASRLYVEAINKLARQAQQGTWGGSADVGSALLQIVEVYKEIQNQQMNILKAFYVDLLVPLETNLEKDTKVVQSEQKRFLQQHKQRSETYSKAAATMKKQRKKNKGSSKTGLAMDKELKNMQVLEEEKSKLDAFCEQSLKTAMTQERRRYGFVLERQCSLAKHYLAYHSHGSTILQRHLDDWQEVAQTREFLPEGVELMFNNRLRQVSFWPDEDVYSSPRSPNMEDDRMSITSQLRKTKSMDASCLDMRSINEATSPLKPLSRAKSDFNLTASTHSLAQDVETALRPKSMAVPDRGWDFQLARALYAYLSSGDNQLSFLEGDVIALMGERNKGWQFGENLRTQCSGWFPLAYTELITDDNSSPTHQRTDSVATTPATPTGSGGFSQQPSSTHSGKSISTPVTMFGDTLLHHRAAKQIHHRGTTISANNVPPPTLPAPVPTPKIPTSTSSSTLPVTQRRLVHPPPMPPLPLLGAAKRPPGAIGNASLHSSNDSGFSNDPPPAPEVDYSDDDTARKPVAADKGEKRKKQLISSVRGWLLYKSALDLWDDVNAQQNGSRALALRQASSVGHLATLGRLSLPLPPQTASPPVPKTSLVKRSKSLWKFRRLHRNGDDGVLEGMALWQHRSLIDVHTAAMQDGRGSPSTPPTIKRKSVSAAPKPLTRTKLEQKEPPKPTERQSIKQAQMLKETQNHKQEQDSNDDQHKSITQVENINHTLTSKQVHKPSQTNGIKQVQSFKQTQNIREINNENSPPLTPRKPIPRAKLDAHNENDDGLLIPPKRSYTSSSEEEQEEEEDEDEQDEDEESCIVVDDHTTRLPRTRLLPERRQRDGRMSAPPPPPPQQDAGLLYYGRTLQYRLKKPERGSRFDEVSATTGNMYGPWYDLWGIDPSVKQQ